MRIIAGKYKGRLLKTAKASILRPTSQKVKQALFNILADQIYQSSFLELFAGSGNVGIEAFSRGAKNVVFVENDRRCLKSIADNLKHLSIDYAYNLRPAVTNQSVCAELLGLDAEKGIELLGKAKKKFDFVFLDPPYAAELIKNCLLKLKSCDILAPRSHLICEHRKDQILPQLIAGLKLIASKAFGDTVLSIYRKGEGE